MRRARSGAAAFAVLLLAAGCTSFGGRPIDPNSRGAARAVEKAEAQRVWATPKGGQEIELFQARVVNGAVCGRGFDDKETCFPLAELASLKVGDQVFDGELTGMAILMAPLCVLTLPICVAMGLRGG